MLQLVEKQMGEREREIGPNQVLPTGAVLGHLGDL